MQIIPHAHSDNYWWILDNIDLNKAFDLNEAFRWRCFVFAELSLSYESEIPPRSFPCLKHSRLVVRSAWMESVLSVAHVLPPAVEQCCKVSKEEMCYKFNLFTDKEKGRLWHEVLTTIRAQSLTSGPREPQTEEERILAASRKVQSWEITRAKHCLTGRALAPGTEATSQEMQSHVWSLTGIVGRWQHGTSHKPSRDRGRIDKSTFDGPFQARWKSAKHCNKMLMEKTRHQDFGETIRHRIRARMCAVPIRLEKMPRGRAQSCHLCGCRTPHRPKTFGGMMTGKNTPWLKLMEGNNATRWCHFCSRSASRASWKKCQLCCNLVNNWVHSSMMCTHLCQPDRWKFIHDALA